jgi:hypothetical protein
MAYALIGTIGAVSQGAASAAVTPAWGTGESRTAGNLLICWVSGTAVATLPTTPSGWTIAKQQAGTSCSVTIYYKVAAGSDAAPTIAAATSGVWAVQLAEFSGGTASPMDQSGAVIGITNPLTATATAADADSGNLVIACDAQFYGMAATHTYTGLIFNNGATAVVTNNSAVSTANNYCNAYGLQTTSNSSADTFSLNAVTTQLTGGALVLASFKAMPTGSVSMSASGNLSVHGPYPYLVAAGSQSLTTGQTVSPTFGQVTTGGHLLVALLGYGATSSPGFTCSDATWSCADPSPGNTMIWYKANCGANETAPTFTASLSSTVNKTGVMVEFGGVAITSPLEQAGYVSGTTSPLTATASVADAAVGNLVVSTSHEVNSSAQVVTTTDAFNNGTALNAIFANDGQASSYHSRLSFGITSMAASADSLTHTDTCTAITGMGVSIASFTPTPTGPPTVTGAVTMSGTAGLTADSSVTEVAAVTMPGASTMTVAAAVQELAAVAMSATTGLVADGTVTVGGGVTVSGTVTLTATAGVTVGATVTEVAAVAMSATAGMTVPGAVTELAAVAMSATTTLSAPATLTVITPVAMSATAGMTVTSGTVVAGTAALSGTAGLSVAAQVAESAVVALSGTAGLSVAGRAQTTATVTLAASAGMTVTAGGAVVAGAAAMTATAVQTVTAGTSLMGAVTETATAGLVVAGMLQRDAQAALSAVAGLAVTAQVVEQASVGLTASAVMTASATVASRAVVALTATSGLVVVGDVKAAVFAISVASITVEALYRAKVTIGSVTTATVTTTVVSDVKVDTVELVGTLMGTQAATVSELLLQ